MKKTIITAILLLTIQVAFAQVTSQRDNGEYAAKIKIAEKAKQLNLGTIHSESSEARPTAGRGGWFLRYEKGWVYYNPKTQNAQALWGDFMTKWATQNYETGWLGFPVSDIRKTPNRTGLFIHFDNGSIYQGPTTGIHFVGGLFREYWSKKGWENSAELGFPKTDEVEIFINGYTRYQQFEKGTLFWGAGKDVLYSNNPNATNPPENNSQKFTLTFEPKNLFSDGDQSEGTVGGEAIDLYGWMDIRVYKGDGKEISDESNKSFSVFYLPEKSRIDNVTAAQLNFLPQNINMHRSYAITQTDIDANAYIRVTYWLNDQDDVSSNDYLKLQAFNGSWNYNKGNHPYREIKLKDIQKNNGILTQIDTQKDGKEYIDMEYVFKILKN